MVINKQKYIYGLVLVIGISLTNGSQCKADVCTSEYNSYVTSTARKVLLSFTQPSGLSRIKPTLPVTQFCPVWSRSDVVQRGEGLLSSTLFVAFYLLEKNKKKNNQVNL